MNHVGLPIAIVMVQYNVKTHMMSRQVVMVSYKNSTLLDATKTFDRVKYVCLFKLLYNKKLPYIMIQTIMNMYEYQKSRTVWNDHKCVEYFTSTNGVHHRGRISPLMFTVYMDELIKEMKVSGIGCDIGHGYLGCLGYIDDLKLLCSSI